MDENMEYITAAPHIKGKSDSTNIYLCLILSLIPAIAFSIYKYQVNAAIHFVVTVLSCVCADYLYTFLIKKKIEFKDLSSVVTGIILALMLPAYAPYYVGIIGGLFAVIIIKHLLGDFTHFYLNPAVTAKCFLTLIVFDSMRKYSEGVMTLPVEILNRGKTVDNYQMMIGNVDGSMGEVCVIALLIGAVILVITGVSDIYIPVSYIVSFGLIMAVFGDKSFDLTYIVSQIAGGGFLMSVWYLSSDLKSSPITCKGQIIYGIILGILTSLTRLFGHYTEEIYFVVLLGNLFVPFIERYTIPKTFYEEG